MADIGANWLKRARTFVLLLLCIAWFRKDPSYEPVIGMFLAAVDLIGLMLTDEQKRRIFEKIGTFVASRARPQADVTREEVYQAAYVEAQRAMAMSMLGLNILLYFFLLTQAIGYLLPQSGLFVLSPPQPGTIQHWIASIRNIVFLVGCMWLFLSFVIEGFKLLAYSK